MNEESDKVPNNITPIATERARKHEHMNGTASAAFRNAVAKISTEYRLQFAWPRDGEEPMTNGKPPLASSANPEPGLGPPRKSISMGTIKPNKSNIAPVHRKRNTEADKKDGQPEVEPLVAESKNEDLRKYKTEYKKKFRPFSHYDYVGGRFLQKEAGDETRNGTIVPTDSTWYQEVLELRKKADEYKHRGWGVELLNESEADNKRLALWEQVLCRSSLSALSLASTTPRSEVKEGKAGKKVWPARTAWSRTTTPHQRDRSVAQNKEERNELRVRSARDNAAKLHIRSASGRSKSVDPGISETKSPIKRTPRSPVPQAATETAKTSTQARPRPTTLTTTASSRLKSSPSSRKSKDDIRNKSSTTATKSSGPPAKKNADASKKYAGMEKKEEEEPTSLIDEPIVKSPPEPTRVKSPEQMMMRSPEPVNWTVPLDTGKTFTVTQNVQGEALARLQGESILSGTTPQTHGQVSSGNSLSLESLEVCKIMDLSFSNENLEHHFEPLDVSSPVPCETNEESTDDRIVDSCQTELGVKDKNVNDVEICLDDSNQSTLSFGKPAENLTDFEAFNNVIVDSHEPEKEIIENLEHKEGGDFEKNEKESLSFNDSGFEKEEERQPDVFSEVSTVEDKMNETMPEREQLKSTSNGSISEGYVSVDKVSNEMNDSFSSLTDEEVQSNFKPTNETHGFEEGFENSDLHRSMLDLSEIENRSLGKYSNDDETDSSYKLDTGHFDHLQHESIFTKEDLMSDKNNSSLDGSEINYSLNARTATEKPDILYTTGNEDPSPVDYSETNDLRDSDSVNSVVETTMRLNENIKEANMSEEESSQPETGIYESENFGTSKTANEVGLGFLNTESLVTSEVPEIESQNEVLGEKKQLLNSTESLKNFNADETLNAHNFIEESGATREQSIGNADPPIETNALHMQTAKEQISVDGSEVIKNSDNTDERYDVVLTTDFEEKSDEIVLDNQDRLSEESSQFTDPNIKVVTHIEGKDLSNDLGTVQDEIDRLSVNSNLHTSDETEGSVFTDEFLTVPKSEDTAMAFSSNPVKIEPTLEQNGVSLLLEKEYLNSHGSVEFTSVMIASEIEMNHNDSNERVIHEDIQTDSPLGHESANHSFEQTDFKMDTNDKNDIHTSVEFASVVIASEIDMNYNDDSSNGRVDHMDIHRASSFDHDSAVHFPEQIGLTTDNKNEVQTGINNHQDLHENDYSNFNSNLGIHGNLISQNTDSHEVVHLETGGILNDQNLDLDHLKNDYSLSHFSNADSHFTKEMISSSSEEDKYSKKDTFREVAPEFTSVVFDEKKSLSSNADFTTAKISSNVQITNIE